MLKCKWSTVLVFMALAALILSSCAAKETSRDIGSESSSAASTALDNAEDPSSAPSAQAPASSAAGEASAASEDQPEGGTKNVDNNIAAFTGISYRITEECYEDGNIIIYYPKITGLKDTNIENKINELIKEDAFKDISEFDSEGDVLEVKFQIAWAGEKLLSIKYVIYSNYSKAAHPSHAFYTTNIYIPAASKIKLADMVKVSDYLADAFIRNAKYVAPFEGGDPDLDKMLEEYINEVDGAYLMRADTNVEGEYNGCFSYFTKDSIGISIEVPFVIGGYAVYEVKYEDLISYIYHGNVIWEDFPELLSKIQNAGNSTIPVIIQDMSPEGWTVLESGGEKAIREGDLNKDGNSDLAFIIEGTGTNGRSAPRTLIVAFGPEYDFKIEAKNAILKADEGGVMGDPFNGIEIKNGSLYLHFLGGSAWRWENSYQFRFQDGDFYLIGATKSFFNINTNEGTKKDYNLLTGDYIITETSKDGSEKITKGNCDKRNKYRLKDFDVRNEDIFDIPSK